MGRKIHSGLAAYIDFIKKHLIFAIVVVIITTGISVFLASKLAIKSDLKALLPDNYQSVEELNKMLDRIGGVSSLIVVAESPNFEANKKFMDDLAVRLNQLPPETIRYIDYKADKVNEFYESNFLYYLNDGDLDRLYSSVERRIDYEKLRHSPIFIDLTDEDPLLSEIEEIKERNSKNYSAPLQTIDNYYGGDWGRMLIMIIRPYGASLTVGRARTLISTVKGVVAELGPTSFNSQMKVGYCGNVVSTVEEYDTLKKDILSTAVLCISLVSLALTLFFLRLRIVFLLGATLLIALSWTFALTSIFIGYLNVQTAFLGSIIIGTGINYGIIVMARYVEERRKLKEHAEAMKEALSNTLSSTFLAAATTGVSFIILLVAKIKGISQFGIIGAIGVLLCWIATILVLPIITLASERICNMVKVRDVPRRNSAFFAMLTKRIVKSPAKILATFIFLAIISAVLIARFAPDSIEYDFTKMRNKVSVSSGTEALEKRVSTLFKHSMTPAVVLVDKMEDAPKVCDAVNKKNLALPESERRVGSCYSIYSLLPTAQEKKIPKIKKFKKLLQGKEDLIAKLDIDLREKIDEIRKSLSTHILSLDDVPAALTKHFEDLDGNEGVVVFVNPMPGMLLSDGRNLMKFADTIRDFKLADGREFHAAGASLIFSDLVSAIRNEAPIITLASFICVLIFITFVVKKWRASWVITGSLVIGITIMLGVLAFFNIKFNFFNFIALPLTFGIGADYAINIALRLAKDEMKDVEHSLRHTGAAVLLCSTTTIIGYSVLIIANNQALASFGTMAIIGEIACISAAALLTPALMVLIKDRLEKKKRDVPAIEITEGTAD
jgi:hypothetical protein